MTLYESGCESELLDQIIAGDKTIEGRLNRDKFATYRIGDLIWLRRDYRDENGILKDGEPRQVLVEIIAIRRYDSFASMVEAEGFGCVMPTASSSEEVANEYDKYYSSEDQAEYGVLAIEIKMKHDKPLAIIAIGIPGCGKTTTLTPMAEKQDLTYVNRDDIREEITGNPTNHTREKLVSRIMLERIQASLSQARGVIVDGTHSRAKDRRFMTDFCHANGAKRVMGMWFDIPIEVCRKRNVARTRVVREAALFTMQHRLTVNPPSIDEGFDAIERIVE